MKRILPLLLCIGLAGCDKVSKEIEKAQTKLIYFGFDDRSEKPEDVLELARIWGSENRLCPHWRPTINKRDADYHVLFGTAKVTIVDRQGEVLYSGGQGVLYLPHGNPDGSGVNICKLTGE